MKKYIYFLLLLLTQVYAQEKNYSLTPEIIKSVNPSKSAIDKISEIDSTIFQKQKDIFNKNIPDILKYLRNIINNDNEQFVKEYAYLRLISTYSVAPHLAKDDTLIEENCIKVLHPNNILFSLDPDIIDFYLFCEMSSLPYVKELKLSHDKSKNIKIDTLKIKNLSDSLSLKIYEEFYNNNQDRVVKAIALIHILRSIKNGEIKNKYYNILKSDYSDIKEVGVALKKYNPNSIVKVGNKVPYFRGKMLGTESYISPNELRGKYYLIYFWATWCNVCIKKMNELEDIYDKYQDKNFTIVTISLDQNDNVIERFRKKEHQIPWLNIRLENGIQDTIWKAFGNGANDGVPQKYLIDPNGMVVETDASWISGIGETIERYLHK
ncbi:MAG: TlpA disulfide reductase family protein [Ignavibacteriaceae bacterium]|nr:TlpA disulfide reductase family protein [Ignavibacteriaceae bacterium]